ncbi:glycoside hydrolase family 127 protein [Pelagicoccus sp. SDUM812003]|uniref:glycoside hydrolase family 127 protein n=1 Tax=Pelagicoccus sp. SDUM812003 TaxID=3041267 RepID=UPI00280DDDC6|nr:glycoside hydrolase family 127 protein [Pelagicoccus sp. SDUM812003]MDQ8202071.1 glycoside hydrolase family 127 protein [Pelagicoccus sp. SDUM812003]
MHYLNRTSLRLNRSLSWLASLCALVPLSLSSAGTESELFSPSSVSLKEGPFLTSLKLNEEMLLQHDPDRLLAPYLQVAGLEPKGEIYGNWEIQGLGGHSAGHYLSALAFTWVNTGDEVFRERMDYMVDELARCQEANGNGYVGGVGKAIWDQLAEGKVDVNRFGMNGGWVPWYNLHKTFMGLKDAWLVGENETAKQTLIELSEWCVDLTDNLDDEQMQRMLYAEYGGMNDLFAEVYQHTGDERYLRLAKRFSDLEILVPLSQAEDPLTGMHANTQIPKVTGFQRIANIDENETYLKAADEFWENVVGSRTVAFGGNSVREHFHPVDDFSTLLESREGPESCNTHNMLRLTAQRFLHDSESRDIDYYERALFNHILSVQNPTTGGYVYFTPIRPRHYRAYSQAEKAFWCCVGSGMENPGRYTELIYTHSEDQLQVNLFIASELDWEEKGVRIVQETDFPYRSSSTLSVEGKAKKPFTLSLRHPAWIDGEMTVTLNGKPIKTSVSENGYIDIKRKWKNGDTLEIDLPMSLHYEQLPDGSPYYAFLYGPIVLAANEGTDDTPGIFAGEGRMEHIAPGPYYPLDRAPTFVGSPEEAVASIARSSSDELRFEFEGDIRNADSETIELEPFYGIHEARYTMYWRVLDSKDYEAALKEIAKKERLQQQRAARVVDEIAPGEQQPEVEHGFAAEGSQSGIMLGRRYREASEWFAYTIKTQDETDLELEVTFWGSQWGRACKILVDGHEVGRIDANGSQPEKFIEASFEIPSEVVENAENGQLRVRVEAIDQRSTPSIFGVALLK